jgi:hypothetical protein
MLLFVFEDYHPLSILGNYPDFGRLSPHNSHTIIRCRFIGFTYYLMTSKYYDAGNYYLKESRAMEWAFIFRPRSLKISGRLCSVTAKMFSESSPPSHAVDFCRSHSGHSPFGCSHWRTALALRAFSVPQRER